MRDWHKLVLVYIAGRKTPASPENTKQYLKKHGISKSHTAITTACKEVLSDVLVRHDHSTYNDDDTVKLKRFKYSLKDDLPTLWKVLVAAGRDRRARQTIHNSKYVSGWYPQLVEEFLWDTRIIKLWTDLYDIYIGDSSAEKRTTPIKKAISRVASLVMKESLIPPPTYGKAGNIFDRIDQLEKNPLLLGNGFFDLDMNGYISRVKKPLRTDDDTESIRLNYYSELFINDPLLLKKHIPKITDDNVDMLKKANVVKNDLEAELGRDRGKEIDAFFQGLYENWLFLKFVVYYILADDDEKTRIYEGLLRPIDDSGTAQFRWGFFAGLRAAHVKTWGLDGVYADYLKKHSYATPLDYLIGPFKDMSRSFDAFSYLSD
jgi:hypothetical protein